jgi:hypothetical protein
MKIFQLPVVIYGHLRDYLIDYPCVNTLYLIKQIRHWKNFLSCSKSFREIKKEHDYYFFQNYCLDVLSLLKSSKARKSDNLPDSPVPSIFSKSRMLDLVQREIKNPSHQIGILYFGTRNLDGFISPCFNVHYLLSVDILGLTDISFLSQVKYVNLAGCCDIKNISSLASCSFVGLSGTGQVVNNNNIHFLCKVKTLCLDKCDGVSDVSYLKDVYNLSLAHCVNVKDVSILARCHRVNISSCNNIKDISSLSHVPYLNIEDMLGVTIGLSSNYSVKELTLNGIMLKRIPFLRSDCHIILTSELSKPFVELAISHGLYQLQKISFTGSIPLVNNWKLYSQLTKLLLNRANLSNTAVSDLPHLKYLEIKYCPQSSFDIDFSTLPALTDLYLETVNLNSFIMSRNNTKLKSVIIDYVAIQDKAIHLYQSLEKLEISRVRGQKVKLVLHCEIEKAQGVTVMNVVCDDHLETITVSDFSQLLH